MVLILFCLGSRSENQEKLRNENTTATAVSEAMAYCEMSRNQDHMTDDSGSYTARKNLRPQGKNYCAIFSWSEDNDFKNR